MNCTNQLLAYADDVNLIDDYIKTIEINADVLLKDISLAVNIGKSKNMKLGVIGS